MARIYKIAQGDGTTTTGIGTITVKSSGVTQTEIANGEVTLAKLATALRVMTQSVLISGASGSFTPTSASYVILIWAKGSIVSANNTTTIQLKSDTTVLDSVIYQEQAINKTVPFALVYKGTLTAVAHTISVSDTLAQGVSNVTILIMEFSP